MASLEKFGKYYSLEIVLQKLSKIAKNTPILGGFLVIKKVANCKKVHYTKNSVKMPINVSKVKS